MQFPTAYGAALVTAIVAAVTAVFGPAVLDGSSLAYVAEYAAVGVLTALVYSLVRGWDP